MRRSLATAFVFVALFGPRRAGAQVRWDAGLAVGVMQRVATGGEPGAKSPMLGPVGELRAHVAIVPALRAGAYVTHDISPVSGATARQMTEGGLQLKFTPPLVRSPWRLWTFVGLGYARTYAPSYVGPTPATATAPSEPVQRVPGVGGGVLDLPFGLGVGLKLRGPWWLFAEIGGRVGVFFAGAMYQREQCLCGDRYVGRDSFAAALSVGLSLEQ
jgi:hypothetical protein